MSPRLFKPRNPARALLERHFGAANVESALDEMLFAGGSLNVKLLGGAAS